MRRRTPNNAQNNILDAQALTQMIAQDISATLHTSHSRQNQQRLTKALTHLVQLESALLRAQANEPPVTSMHSHPPPR